MSKNITSRCGNEGSGATTKRGESGRGENSILCGRPLHIYICMLLWMALIANANFKADVCYVINLKLCQEVHFLPHFYSTRLL